MIHNITPITGSGAEFAAIRNLTGVRRVHVANRVYVVDADGVTTAEIIAAMESVTTLPLGEQERQFASMFFSLSVADNIYNSGTRLAFDYVKSFSKEKSFLTELDVLDTIGADEKLTPEYFDLILEHFPFLTEFKIDAFYDNEVRETPPSATKFVGAGTWRFTSWKINGNDVINPTETIVIDAANLDDLFERLLPILNENDPINGGNWTFENTGDYARHWRLSGGNYADYGEIRLYENATGNSYSKLTPLVEYI